MASQEETTPIPGRLQSRSSRTVACISCRLQRKKCGMEQPICSRCKEFNIPEEWCIYHDNARLYEKDSAATMARENARNKELQQELQKYTRLYALMRDSRDRMGEEALFFSGKRPILNGNFAQLTGAEGYYAGLSLPASVFASTKTVAPLGVTDAVNLKYRRQYTQQRKQEQELHEQLHPGIHFPNEYLELDTFENMCMANLVGVPAINSSMVPLHKLLKELERVIPPQEEFDLYFQIFEDKNGADSPIGTGCPLYPKDLVSRMKDVVHYGSDGKPVIQIGLPEPPQKLITLVLTLVVLISGHFIVSKIPSLHCFNPFLHIRAYERYARCILHSEYLDSELESPLLTLAHYQLHLVSRYSCNQNLDDERTDYRKEMVNTAHTTKSIISLARSQHLHENISSHYHGLSDEYIKLYTDLWNCIIMIDTVACMELGHYSSIKLPGLDTPSDGTNPPTIAALKTIHQTLNNFALIDGDLTARNTITFAEDSIKTLKSHYLNLPNSIELDFQMMSSLNPQGLKDDPDLIRKYYQCYERTIIRLFIVGVLHSLYCLCLRCLEDMGETYENSRVAYAYRVLSQKYCYGDLQIIKYLARLSSQAGNDEDNVVGQIHATSILFVNGIRESCYFRAAIWISMAARDSSDLSRKEVLTYLKYFKEDEVMDSAVMALLEKEGQFEEPPGFTDLYLDFDIDDDHERLLKELGKISEARRIVYSIKRDMMELTENCRPKFMNTDYITLSKSMLGVAPSCSLGLRYFFPDEFKECFRSLTPNSANYATGHAGSSHSTVHNDQATVSDGTNVDFTGAFEGLFEHTFSDNEDDRNT